MLKTGFSVIAEPCSIDDVSGLATLASIARSWSPPVGHCVQALGQDSLVSLTVLSHDRLYKLVRAECHRELFSRVMGWCGRELVMCFEVSDCHLLGLRFSVSLTS